MAVLPGKGLDEACVWLRKAALTPFPPVTKFEQDYGLVRDGSHALDPDRLSPADARVVAALRAYYLSMVLPTAVQLGNLEYFIRRGAG